MVPRWFNAVLDYAERQPDVVHYILKGVMAVLFLAMVATILGLSLLGVAFGIALHSWWGAIPIALSLIWFSAWIAWLLDKEE